MGFSRGKDIGADGKARAGQTLPDRLQVEGGHDAVGNDCHMTGGHDFPQAPAALFEQAGAGSHRIGGRGVDLDGVIAGHKVPPQRPSHRGGMGILGFEIRSGGGSAAACSGGCRTALHPWERDGQFPPADAFSSRPSFKRVLIRSASRDFSASE